MKGISFKEVAKNYGAVAALRPTSFAVKEGEFLTLLGPSGSGKTTLLNIVAGHLQPSSGSVLIGDQDVSGQPARKRNIGMVFQNYALFPHMNVFENVAYGLRVRRTPRAELEQRVREALALVQLQEMADRHVQKLSGGQQQRVALARAVVIKPDVLLLDEPMGALDRQLRKQLQLELRALHSKLGHTTLYVTHDQEEALALSDRIAIFRAGQLEQLDTARRLYRHPRNAFVASFLGESNLPTGRLTAIEEGQGMVESADVGGVIRGRLDAALDVGDAASAVIRPEDVTLGEADVTLKGTVSEVIFLGELTSVRVRLPSGYEIWSRRPGSVDVEVGSEVSVGWHHRDVGIVKAA